MMNLHKHSETKGYGLLRKTKAYGLTGMIGLASLISLMPVNIQTYADETINSEPNPITQTTLTEEEQKAEEAKIKSEAEAKLKAEEEAKVKAEAEQSSSTEASDTETSTESSTVEEVAPTLLSASVTEVPTTETATEMATEQVTEVTTEAEQTPTVSEVPTETVSEEASVVTENTEQVVETPQAETPSTIEESSTDVQTPVEETSNQESNAVEQEVLSINQGETNVAKEEVASTEQTDTVTSTSVETSQSAEANQDSETATPQETVTTTQESGTTQEASGSETGESQETVAKTQETSATTKEASVNATVTSQENPASETVTSKSAVASETATAASSATTAATTEQATVSKLGTASREASPSQAETTASATTSSTTTSKASVQQTKAVAVDTQRIDQAVEEASKKGVAVIKTTENIIVASDSVNNATTMIKDNYTLQANKLDKVASDYIAALAKQDTDISRLEKLAGQVELTDSEAKTTYTNIKQKLLAGETVGQYHIPAIIRTDDARANEVTRQAMATIMATHAAIEVENRNRTAAYNEAAAAVAKENRQIDKENQARQAAYEKELAEATAYNDLARRANDQAKEAYMAELNQTVEENKVRIANYTAARNAYTAELNRISKLNASIQASNSAIKYDYEAALAVATDRNRKIDEANQAIRATYEAAVETYNKEVTSISETNAKRLAAYKAQQAAYQTYLEELAAYEASTDGSMAKPIPVAKPLAPVLITLPEKPTLNLIAHVDLPIAPTYQALHELPTKPILELKELPNHPVLQTLRALPTDPGYLAKKATPTAPTLIDQINLPDLLAIPKADVLYYHLYEKVNPSTPANSNSKVTPSANSKTQEQKVLVPVDSKAMDQAIADARKAGIEVEVITRDLAVDPTSVETAKKMIQETYANQTAILNQSSKAYLDELKVLDQAIKEQLAIAHQATYTSKDAKDTLDSLYAKLIAGEKVTINNVVYALPKVVRTDSEVANEQTIKDMAFIMASYEAVEKENAYRLSHNEKTLLKQVKIPTLVPLPHKQTVIKYNLYQLASVKPDSNSPVTPASKDKIKPESETTPSIPASKEAVKPSAKPVSKPSKVAPTQSATRVRQYSNQVLAKAPFRYQAASYANRLNDKTIKYESSTPYQAKPTAMHATSQGQLPRTNDTNSAMAALAGASLLATAGLTQINKGRKRTH